MEKERGPALGGRLALLTGPHHSAELLFGFFFCLLGNSPAPPPPTAKPNGNHGAPPQPGLTRPNRNHGAPPQRLPLLPESPSQGKRDLSVSLTASLLPNNHRVQKLPPRYVWRTCPEPSPGQAPPGPSCSLSPSGVGVGVGAVLEEGLNLARRLLRQADRVPHGCSSQPGTLCPGSH